MTRFIPLTLIAVFPVYAELTLNHSDSDADQKGVVTFATRPDQPKRETWSWARNGNVILERVKTEYSGTTKSSRIDQIIFHNGEKIFLSLLLDKAPSEIFYPTSSIKVLRSDTDKDGILDSISLMDSKDHLVELFSIDSDGLISPASDKDLSERRKLIADFSNAMKDF